MTFQMWSTLHIAFILSPFVFAAAFYFALRKKDFETKRFAGIIMSGVAVAFLLARNIEIFIKNGGRIEPEILPLQICHFANFVLLFAFLFNSRLMFAFAFCLNLPAAYMSIIFANSLANYTTILTARGLAYIFGHMLIVGITLWALLSDFIKMDFRILLKTCLLVVGLYVISVPVNNLFNFLMPDYSANYFYSMKPESGTPLELFYEWGGTVKFLGMSFNPLYMLLTALLGIAVVSAFYGMYVGGYKIKSKLEKPIGPE